MVNSRTYFSALLPLNTHCSLQTHTHTQQHSLMHIANFSLARVFFIIFSFIYISLFQVISRHFIIIIDLSISRPVGAFSSLSVFALFSIIQCSWLFSLACGCVHWRSFKFVFYCHFSPTQAPLVLRSLSLVDCKKKYFFKWLKITPTTNLEFPSYIKYLLDTGRTCKLQAWGSNLQLSSCVWLCTARLCYS